MLSIDDGVRRSFVSGQSFLIVFMVHCSENLWGLYKPAVEHNSDPPQDNVEIARPAFNPLPYSNSTENIPMSFTENVSHWPVSVSNVPDFIIGMHLVTCQTPTAFTSLILMHHSNRLIAERSEAIPCRGTRSVVGRESVCLSVCAS